MLSPEIYFSQPIFQALGWALVHSLWQIVALAIIYAAVSALLKETAANIRYLFGCAALALALLMPLATGYFVLRASQSTLAASAELTGARSANGVPTRVRLKPEQGALLPDELGDAISPDSSSVAWQERAGARLTTLLPWMVVAWLCGVTLLLLRFAVGWAALRRLRRSARPLEARWRESLARLSKRMRVSRALRLCESALVEAPTVVGWLRPLILIPASALAGLSVVQLEAILAHELAHIRRHDYLVNLLQTAVETLLFYHPAVWWLSRRIRSEREHACDDLAVATTGDVLLYARALTQLETMRRRSGGHSSPSALALAANGGSLMRRIQRLVKTQTPAQAHPTPFVAVAVLAVMLCSVLAGGRALVTTDAAGINSINTEKTAHAKPVRQVAVTFVNFPANNIYDDGRLQNKTRKLMRSLASEHIQAVAFVNEARLYKDDSATPDDVRVGLLREWLDAGHELGNETYKHTSLYGTSLADFESDVLRGEQIMSPLARAHGQSLRYFSYPYLNTGANGEQKRAAEEFLRGRGYQIHPVTIDNMDWLFSHAYIEALRREDTAAMERIRADYIPYMERMFEFYEEYSREVVGHEIPQVLMLTSGALNADCFDDLAAMLKRRGYSFVTMEQATKDAAYSLPDTYTGERGDSWIARWAATKGMEYKDTEQVYLPASMQQYYTELKKTWASKSNGGKK